MFFVWDLGSQEENLAAFNELNNARDVVLSQGSLELKTLFHHYGLNYPNNQGTERYAEPRIHSDGRVAMAVPTAVFSQVSQALKEELWSLVTPPSEIVQELDNTWIVESD